VRGAAAPSALGAEWRADGVERLRACDRQRAGPWRRPAATPPVEGYPSRSAQCRKTNAVEFARLLSSWNHNRSCCVYLRWGGGSDAG
jgi:hypothetical protein